MQRGRRGRRTEEPLWFLHGERRPRELQLPQQTKINAQYQSHHRYCPDTEVILQEGQQKNVRLFCSCSYYTVLTSRTVDDYTSLPTRRGPLQQYSVSTYLRLGYLTDLTYDTPYRPPRYCAVLMAYWAVSRVLPT